MGNNFLNRKDYYKFLASLTKPNNNDIVRSFMNTPPLTPFCSPMFAIYVVFCCVCVIDI